MLVIAKLMKPGDYRRESAAGLLDSWIRIHRIHRVFGIPPLGGSRLPALRRGMVT